jgi:hypothetical protein
MNRLCFLLAGALALFAGTGCAASGVSEPYLYPGPGQSVELVDGAYHWTAIDPATFGGAIYAIAPLSPTDVWFFGHDARHWDGKVMTRMPLVAEGSAGDRDLTHFAQSFAVRSPTDIWIAGSAIWHYDGAEWTEKTSMIPHVGSETFGKPNRFELAGDATSLVIIRLLGQGLFTFDGTAFAPGICLPKRDDGVYWATDTALFVDNGVPGAVGMGVCDGTTDKTMPGLRKSGLVWARSGKHFYSYVSGQFGADTIFPDVLLSEATAPDDFQATIHVPLTGLPGLAQGKTVTIGPYYGSPASAGVAEIDIASIAVLDDGALYLGNAQDAHGQTSFLIRTKGGVGEVLSDRLYGWVPFALAVSGEQIFVAASSGAIFLGTKK